MLMVNNVLINGAIANILVNRSKIIKIDRNSIVANEPVTDIIDGTSMAALPFLYNGHTHSPMVLLRGYGDDMLLDEWLQKKVWPIEKKLTDEDYYWGNRLALVEMIKSGTGFFNEMYMNPESMIDALRELPIKALINYPIIDGMDENRARKQIKECEKFFEKLKLPENITMGLALHSVYANSSYSLQWVRDFAAERSLSIHIHLSETEKEVEDCRSAHNNLSPIEFLDSFDFFKNTVYGAHCVWLSESDIRIMSDRQVVAVHNPVSNMKLATGKAFPYKQLKDNSVPIVLGTDGAASNNNLDLFEEMKIAALLQKHHFRDPTLMTAEEIFSITTERSAHLFHQGAGALIECGEADFMLIKLNESSMTPATDLISNIVYSGSGALVDSLICSGKIIMKNRKINGEDNIRENAVRCAHKLISGHQH